MILVTTLGGLWIEADGRVLGDALAQAKPLSLMAMLAASGAEGVSRSQVTALLWPEAGSEARSRHALTQTLYTIRRVVGPDAVHSVGQRLTLNDDVISADVAALRLASQNGDWSRVISLYHGPFLDGFVTRRMPQFELWVDDQRRSCRALFRRALDEQLSLADAWGDHNAWRDILIRRVEECWDDEQAAAHGLRLLGSRGEQDAALEAGSRYLTRAQREFGDTPPAAMVAIVRILRIESQSRTSGAAVPPGEIAETAPTALRRSLPAPDVYPPIAITVAPRGDTSKPPRNSRRIAALVTIPRLALTVAATLVVVLAVTATRSSSRAPLEPQGSQGVASRPQAPLQRKVEFIADVDDGALTQRLRRDVFELLETLPSVQVLHGNRGTADSTAILVELAAEQDPDTLEVRVKLTAHTRHRSIVTLRCATIAPVDCVRRATRQIVLATLSAPRDGLAFRAASSTQSIDALRSYLLADERFSGQEFGKAVEALQQALHADSMFALAAYRLSQVADWTGDGRLMMQSARQAARLATAPSKVFQAQDRTLAVAQLDWREGRVDDAETALRLLARAQPDLVEAQYMLGEVQFHSSPFRGRSVTRAAEAFRAVIAAVPEHKESLTHLLRIAGRSHDTRAIVAISRRLADSAY